MPFQSVFCIHFLVLPIEESMKEQRKFPYSLGTSIFFVTVTNTAFGFLGYLFFGEDTCSIIIINLGDNIWVIIVKICLCIDLLFTYAIVFAPGREIIEKSILMSNETLNKNKLIRESIRNLIRTLLVGVTVAISQVHQFGIITNLVGGFSMSSLGLVLPPLFYLKFYHSKLSWPNIILHVIIILVGIAAVGFTTVLTIVNIFKDSSTGC